MTDEPKTPAEAHFDSLIAERRAVGRKTYGHGIDHLDGHDWQAEALAEALDCCQYLAAENLRLREELKALKPLEPRTLDATSMTLGEAVLFAVRQLFKERNHPTGVAFVCPKMFDMMRNLGWAVIAHEHGQTEIKPDRHVENGSILIQTVNSIVRVNVQRA